MHASAMTMGGRLPTIGSACHDGPIDPRQLHDAFRWDDDAALRALAVRGSVATGVRWAVAVGPGPTVLGSGPTSDPLLDPYRTHIGPTVVGLGPVSGPAGSLFHPLV